MSLTSYRAAPPRGGVWFVGWLVCLGCSGLGRPGGDLLSRVLRRSTIGAEGFHGRVRDGIGCLAPRHDHQVDQDQRTEVRNQKPEASVSGFWLLVSGFWFLLRSSAGRAGSPLRCGGGIKPIERLVPVSCAACTASTPGLS